MFASMSKNILSAAVPIARSGSARALRIATRLTEPVHTEGVRLAALRFPRCPALRIATALRLRASRPPRAWQSSTAILSTGPDDHRHHSRPHRSPSFRIVMSDEEKKSKQETIQQQNAETVPSGMFAKVKYYCKRYWYIAIPVHMVSSTIWFTSSYALVASGVDVLELLKTLHMPDLILDKVASAPASAGFFVIALIIYKIATPLRYATTLLGIQLTFKVLQRMGRLRTLNEVEYKVRSEYERRGRFTTQRPRGTGVRSPPIQHSVKESSKK